MKPIKLKIKGLNSFIEEQEIDFTELTKCGFFGVFGKTGSGKSTILDAITLALYGKISRDSQNFINANCTAASVSFEFHINSDIVREYIVMRDFRLDKKTQTPKANKCKLIEKTGGTEVILADAVREVNDQCTEIIGLGIEDFMRTVVLPQGKFSEFLKLSGKPRRNMLERLFQLQKYGDQLTQKLNRSTRQYENELNKLEGELIGYEEVSEERYHELEENQKLVSLECTKLSKEYDALSMKQSVAKEVRALMEEKEALFAEETSHKARQPEIMNGKNRLSFARKAVFIYPSICNSRQTKLDLIKEGERLDKYSEELSIKEEEFKQAEKEEQEAVARKDENLPRLEITRKDIKTAKEEFIKNQAITNEIQSKRKSFIDTKQELELLQTELVEAQAQKDKIKEKIDTTDDAYQKLKIDVDYKKLVEQGKKAEEEKERYFQLEKELSEDITKLTKETEQISIDKESCLADQKSYEESLERIKSELEQILPPGDVNDLEQMSKRENDYFNQLTEYKKSVALCLESEEKRKEIMTRAEELRSERTILLKKEEELVQSQKKEERENLAAILREDLKEGEPCPVCGGLHHEIVAIAEVAATVETENKTDEITRLREELDVVRTQLAANQEGILKAEIEQARLQEVLAEEKSKIVLLGEVKEDVMQALSAQRQSLKKSIEDYNAKREERNKQKEELLSKLSKCSQKLSGLFASYTANSSILAEKVKKKEENDTMLQQADAMLKQLIEKTSVEEFHNEYQRIYAIEKQREQLEHSLTELRNQFDGIAARVQLKEQKREQLTLSLSNIKGEFDALQKEWKEIEARLLKLLNGRKDIEIYEQETISEIKKLEEALKAAQENKRKKQTALKEIQEERLKSKTLTEGYQKTILELEQQIASDMVRYQFNTEEEVINAYLGPEQMDSLQQEMEAYEKAANEIAAKLRQVMDKLAGRSVSEEDYRTLTEQLDEQRIALDSKKEQQSLLRESMTSMKKAIQELSERLKQKEALVHRLSIHAELERLLRGNRFVEFVAQERLEYISIEASKRLNEISNGIYGLEINDAGEFLIRDNKNGGILRDASTLSGGETFITSLSLALALSSEIQLKGTAPLELFFLDEGFGTLDEDMLEVVISSLERIHHDKLRIGLISHVEAIKNRVPVKLMVTPAQSGLGGSKVKIEYS